ncbi:hypothetical protein B296_00053161 [Ensete ventricosum]|uniref:Uncharacterized protein n=1 Tax=Ensete ventricosum TaxID=4639 RepID=A0A426Y9I0_ENSVE|nr:hypothetical protein B296_00053161 [Ensete ventricosum]
MAAAGAISGTGSGITALLRLRRPAPRHPSVAACSLADGGNPICGRHLRPSLIHLDRSFPPSRIPAAVSKKGGLLRPVAPAAAASSSPAEGSYYVGFVSVIHLFVGVVYCLVSWAVGLPKRAVSFAGQTPIACLPLKLLLSFISLKR